jgi:hypothetical protein
MEESYCQSSSRSDVKKKQLNAPFEYLCFSGCRATPAEFFFQIAERNRRCVVE